MPEVTDEFIKNAQVLSKAIPGLLDKVQNVAKEAAVMVKTQAEVVADTLIEQGLAKSADKAEAVEKLSDHRQALTILNRTAQQVGPTSLGGPEKEAEAVNDGSMTKPSDRLLLERLGFQVAM